MQITLEQSLIDLMDKHNLDSISVGMIRGADGKAFPNCNVQANGFCGMSYDKLSLPQDLAAAIDRLNAKRSAPPVIELPALVIGETA